MIEKIKYKVQYTYGFIYGFIYGVILGVKHRKARQFMTHEEWENMIVEKITAKFK